MQFNPVVIIPGIGQSKVDMVDGSGNKIKSAWPVELDEKALLNDLKGSLMKMLIFKKDGGFSDKVAGIVKDICEPLAMNPDGSKKNNVKPVSYDKSVAECTEDEKRYIYKMVPLRELSEKIGEDRLFFFAYDPFGDVFDIAAKLDKFIESVKVQTGSEKVDLLTVSLGGGVLRAYLMGYAEKGDCEKVVSVVAALDGSEAAADIIENKLQLGDPVGLLNSLGGKAKDMSSMIGMLPGDVIQTVIAKALEQFKASLVYYCTSMWAMIPANRFEAVYSERKSKGIDPALDSKIKMFADFNADFANKAKALSENGMKFFNLCGYGDKMLPIFACEELSSDGIINLHSSSLGIAGCRYDETPDVSGAAFPETTWLFKEQSHGEIAENKTALSLVTKIFTGEVENVNSDAEYPQFCGNK